MSIQARFKTKRGDFLLDAEFSIPETGITALFGTSGSGKTSLLRAIAGLDHHKNGFVKVGDEVWQEDQFFLSTHKRALAYVFQEANLFPHLNVIQNIEYGLKRIKATERKIELQQVIELLGIEKLLQRSVNALSGGEQQRVAISRALAVSPKLLLMDEPLASLDAERKREVLPYIESLHRELALPIFYVSHAMDEIGLHRELALPIFYVSHAMDEIATIADRLILITNGKTSDSGKIGDMLTRMDSALAHKHDAAAIIDAVVLEHDETYALTYLDCPAGRFAVAKKPVSVGDNVRLRIAARDVSLTLSKHSDSSILNCFAATIDDLSEESTGQVTVRLLANGIPLLARITSKSSYELGLQIGKTVYAQVKSVALLN